jgi:hypothetical protein
MDPHLRRVEFEELRGLLDGEDFADGSKGRVWRPHYM